MSKKLIVRLLASLSMCVCGIELATQYGYRDFYRNFMKAKLALAKEQAHKFKKEVEEREPAHGVPAAKKNLPQDNETRVVQSNDQTVKVRAKL